MKLEAQYHVVEGEAGIEAASLVEVDHLVDGVRRRVFANVGKRSAVTHRLDPRPRGIVEPKELARPDAVQALPLLGAVAAGAAFHPVDHRLRDEHARGRPRVEDLVGVQVIALADADWRSFLGLEVEARVDLILAVGEVEAHGLTRRASRWSRWEEPASLRACPG